ncbi:hypothetical protein BJD43_gp024 [Cyanophage S-RIM50]|uniref:Uncharacterized protein n=1 Tax=Cyanophage S-RIM50 TaxID=687803 RepID=A0A127KM55_9CAUD|nr:hypothetical protein BJD43_gp024 [Cyanophage S-RIM50]AMO43006.1 hypothetical protein R290704_226 [Cyanophage S-RIM50]
MTVYAFKKDIEEATKEQLEELEEQEKKKEAVKALGIIVGIFTKPLILMLLWNWLMPGIFGLAAIGYFKAVGFYLISRILFSNDK